MLQIFVVMLEGRARVLGSIDVDALHPPGINGQQRLQISPLGQHVPGIPVPRRQLGNLFQQPVRHASRRADILLRRKPVQRGHALVPATDAVMPER